MTVAAPARRLVLLRHGRTSWNETGRAQGHADIDLDDAGHAQARAAAAYLAVLDPVAVWTSDLVRARQTAAHLEAATGLSAKVDERLREYDIGVRQGLTLPEFADRFPVEYAAWERADDRVRVAGAESDADVEQRIVPALHECLAALSPGDTGVVVTHGASLIVGLVGLLEWPPEQSAALRAMDNCAWAVVSAVPTAAGERLRLEAYNVQAGSPDGAFTYL